MLEELEEFTEREHKFEVKYNKTVSQLKLGAERTEAEIKKVKYKVFLGSHYLFFANQIKNASEEN